MQETRVLSLIWEDPTCLRATKPALHNKRSHGNERPTHSTHSLQPGKSPHSEEDPAQPKINKYNEHKLKEN